MSRIDGLKLLTDFPDFFRLATERDPYPYQVRLSSGALQAWALNIPTGAGKTAAVVLAWLYRLKYDAANTPRRMAYCLPMRVLVEQTAHNAGEWISRTGADVQLAVLMGGEVNQEWEIRPERACLLIGTQDMLLSRALNRGYAMSRFRWPTHFGLLNSDCLWVCDEVQLMGDGLATSTQLAAFRRGSGTFGTCPTIWMSATMDTSMLQSVDVKKSPEQFSLLDEDLAVKGLSDRLHAVKRVMKAPEECRTPAGLAAFLAERHKPGTQTIAVVNRVARARETYNALCKLAPDIPCHLLHSRFRPWEKRAWQSLFESKPIEKGRILISTQVVEAGVDISSAVLVTDLAPWSSLVQRFGRCNRAGEFPDGAEIFWIDRPASTKTTNADELTDEAAKPYTKDELAEAESRLIAITSATPADLPRHETRYEPKHVLRRRDIVDLFDTTADLSGYDIDVSRFIRSEQDKDVQVAWRETFPPTTTDEAPARDELCSAPIGDVKELLKVPKKGRQRFAARTWNALEGSWVQVEPDQLRPGMVLIADARSGCYDEKRGWDPESTRVVIPVPEQGGGTDEEAMDADPASFPEYPRKYAQTLEAHSREVLGMMQEITMALGTSGINLSQYRDDLLTAAQYHDWGKAHPVFQKTVNPENGPVLIAKSRNRRSHSRKHFRHELASALALLQMSASDLSAYLAAAHHGKVRLSIRALAGECKPEGELNRFARGIFEGDVVSSAQLGDAAMASVTLSLEPMLMGTSESGARSWLDRMLTLRDQIGMFRLAYLEALIVAADCRASSKPKVVME